MTESPPHSSPLWTKAKELYDSTEKEIGGLPYENKTFQWGRGKIIPDDVRQEWKKELSTHYNVDDVGVSRFTGITTINYKPHGIILIPFSNITLRPLDSNNNADPKHEDYVVVAGNYTYLRSTKVNLLSGEVDMIVAKLKP